MRCGPATWASLALVLLLGGTAGVARAYTVGSGFSDPCHEVISRDAGLQTLAIAPPAGPQLTPPGGVWPKIDDYFVEVLSLDAAGLSAVERFRLMSLIIGVRAPDTDGHSIMNLENLHRLHGDPSARGQYAHALRAPDDDYAAGDAAAVLGTRAHMLELVETAQLYLAEPPDAQVINATVYLDFYGRTEIPVWAPLYYAGRAAHALQDTFSHTVRDDEGGLRQVVHVLNYIDAVGASFDEEQDGLAHSDFLDRCNEPELAELREAAVTATAALLQALRAQFTGDDPHAVEGVLDEWLTLRPGCSRDNDFCGNSRWLAVARRQPTGPYLGCRSGGGAATSLAALVAAVLFLLRTRRRARPR